MINAIMFFQLQGSFGALLPRVQLSRSRHLGPLLMEKSVLRRIGLQLGKKQQRLLKLFYFYNKNVALQPLFSICFII